MLSNGGPMNPKAALEALVKITQQEGHLDLDYDLEEDRFWVGKGSGRTLEEAIKNAVEVYS